MFKFLWKMIKWFFILTFVAFCVLVVIEMNDPEAQAKLKQDRIEKCLAEIGAGSCDEDGYETQESKDKKALIEIEEKAKADKLAAEAKAKADARIAAAKAKKVAEEKRKGFHCLSGWDGSHRDIVRATKKQLRDPKSFEHIETRVTPVKDFKHTLYMNYRAKNGFGGMAVGTVVATYSNASCNIFTIISID